MAKVINPFKAEGKDWPRNIPLVEVPVNVCPLMSRCVTSAYWGQASDFFIRTVCITSEHKSCLHYFSDPKRTYLNLYESDGQCVACPTCGGKGWVPGEL